MDTNVNPVKSHLLRNREIYGFAAYAIGTVAISVGTRKVIEKGMIAYIDARSNQK